MVFAAVAVERGLHAIAARQRRAVVALGAGQVVAGTITHHERCEATHDGIPAVCLGVDSWFDSEWLKLAQWYLDNGALDQAVRYAERAYECRRPRSAGMARPGSPAWRHAGRKNC